MLNLLKKLWSYLMEKIHITLTPSSPSKRVKNFKIRRIYPVILVVVLISAIFSLSFLYKFYEKNYYVADNKLQKLKNVEEENKYLKSELVALTKDTEELTQALVNLREYNNNIKNMIDKSGDSSDKMNQNENINMQLRTVVSYNNSLFQQGVPMGGGNFQLLYQDSTNLIKSMQNNVNVVKNEIPQQRENLKELETEVKEYNAEMAATPNIWPVADKGRGYISSNFGWRNHPTTSERQFHEGLDIAVWYNTPVLATAYGRVTHAGWSSGYGWTIRIDHGFGYETIYGHLNKLKVEKGEKVKRGQTIALSGNSGRSTGPHLHYEVRVNNVPKNPRDFVGR